MGAVSLVFKFSPGLSCDTALRSEVMMRGRLFPHTLVAFLHLSVFITIALMDGCDPVWTHGLGRFLNQCRQYLLEGCYPGAGAPEGAGKGDISKGGVGITSPWPLGRITWRCLLQRASHSAQAWQPHRD